MRVLKSSLGSSAFLVVLALCPDPTLAQDDVLPDLTPEGVAWAQKVIANAKVVAAGHAVTTPPFVHPEDARLISRVAAAVDKAATLPVQQPLARDPAFLALADVLEARVGHDETAAFEDVATLYQMLNARVQDFSAGAPLASGPNAPRHLADAKYPRRMVLPLTKVIGALVPNARPGESRTDGQRIEFEPRFPGQAVDFDWVNGIQAPLMDAIPASLVLQHILRRDINHIHNRAGTLLGDVIDAYRDLKQIGSSKPADRVKAEVLEHARAGQPYIVLCHSQGAAVCARGLAAALEEAAGDPALACRIRRLVGMVSLGGFTLHSKVPDGILHKEIVRPGDGVPAAAGLLDFSGPLDVLLGGLTALGRAASTQKAHSLVDSYLDEGLAEVIDAVTEMELTLRAGVNACESSDCPGPLSGLWLVRAAAPSRFVCASQDCDTHCVCTTQLSESPFPQGSSVLTSGALFVCHDGNELTGDADFPDLGTTLSFRGTVDAAGRPGILDDRVAFRFLHTVRIECARAEVSVVGEGQVTSAGLAFTGPTLTGVWQRTDEMFLICNQCLGPATPENHCESGGTFQAEVFPQPTAAPVAALSVRRGQEAPLTRRLETAAACPVPSAAGRGQLSTLAAGKAISVADVLRPPRVRL